MIKVGIVGYGIVGKAMHRLFPNSIFFDPFIAGSASKEEINSCEAVFVCVPTPMKADGSCDVSVVEETFAWLTAPLVIIRSTVAPGTTDRLAKQYAKRHIVFQPEYLGESTAHPLTNESERNFIILGGSKQACREVIENVYQSVYNASVRIMCITALEAEVTKYMENTAIGTLVTLYNEFYNIARAFGVDYTIIREAFLMDPRMSRYFTFVYPDKRGFEGKCLPKDINAIVKASEAAGYTPEFIKDVLKNNDRIRGVGGSPA